MAEITIVATGDLILDEPGPMHAYFKPTGSVLRQADVLIGHVETPHTDRPLPSSTDVPAPPAKPEHLDAMGEVGFHVATLAGNHMHDSGLPGIEDTIARLRIIGISTTGAGKNLDAAREPALAQAGGLTLGVLSYNAVGPREGWANSQKYGCAYVRVLTHYELEQASPGSPPEAYTFPDPKSVERMQEDIARLRERCDLVAVAIHKGSVHVPARIEMYERPVCHAAVDAGADFVLGHHAHILKGIEIYRGKPIYHGLGNFVTVTYALTPVGDITSPERLAWIERRKKFFGFEPDPAMPFYPFHPESRNTILAKIIADQDGVRRFGFIPCRINEQGVPEIAARENGGEEVAEYVAKISESERLGTCFLWREGWVEAMPQ